MGYIIDPDLNADVQKIYAGIVQLDIITPGDGDVDYKQLYMFLFNRISDIAEELKNALESNDPSIQTKVVLQTVTALWNAQIEAEAMFLSKTSFEKTPLKMSRNNIE